MSPLQKKMWSKEFNGFLIVFCLGWFFERVFRYLAIYGAAVLVRLIWNGNLWYMIGLKKDKGEIKEPEVPPHTRG